MSSGSNKYIVQKNSIRVEDTEIAFEDNIEETLEVSNMLILLSGTKKDMHQWQHEKIQEHKDDNNGQRPDLNKNDYLTSPRIMGPT